MRLRLKIMVLAAVFLAARPAAAEQVSTQISVNVREAVSITILEYMDFGVVSYADGASGLIRLGGDDVVSVSGTGYLASGTPKGAELAVSATLGQDVAISCETGAVMEEAGGNQIVIQNAEVSPGTPAAFGSGTDCAGLESSPAVYTMGSGDDTLYVGAEIDGTTPPATAGTYSTATGSGHALSIRVVYN